MLLTIWRPLQGLGNVYVIDHIGLDTVAPPLDLRRHHRRKSDVALGTKPKIQSPAVSGKSTVYAANSPIF